jgi:WD40 repeat protein
MQLPLAHKGDTLASGSHDQAVRLWDVSTGECLRVFQGHSNWIFSVTFDLKVRYWLAS